MIASPMTNAIVKYLEIYKYLYFVANSEIATAIKKKAMEYLFKNAKPNVIEIHIQILGLFHFIITNNKYPDSNQ